MPKKGQKYAPRVPYEDVVREFGQAAVDALGRPDNLKARGVTAHGLFTLMTMRARHVQPSGPTPPTDMRPDRVRHLLDFALLLLSTPGLRQLVLQFPWTDQKNKDLVERVRRALESETDVDE